MKNQAQPGNTELLLLGYLCLVIDFIAKPNELPNQFCAQVTLLAGVLDLLVVYFLFSGFFRCAAGNDAFGATAQGVGSALFKLSGFLVLTVAAGQSVSVSWRFLKGTVDRILPFAVFLTLLLGVGAYAVHLGIFAITRAGEVIFVLFVCSVGFIAFANLEHADLQNLAMSEELGNEVVSAAVRGFSVSPSLLAWSIVTAGQADRRKGLTEKLFASIALSLCGFALFSELVLGSFAAGQSQPFYTLARIGNLSVFKRLDSLHAFAWSLVMGMKLVLLLFAAAKLLAACLPAGCTHASITGTVLAAAVCALLLPLSTARGIKDLVSVGTILSMIFAASIKGEKKPLKKPVN